MINVTFFFLWNAHLEALMGMRVKLSWETF